MPSIPITASFSDITMAILPWQPSFLLGDFYLSMAYVGRTLPLGLYVYKGLNLQGYSLLFILWSRINISPWLILLIDACRRK